MKNREALSSMCTALFFALGMALTGCASAERAQQRTSETADTAQAPIEQTANTRDAGTAETPPLLARPDKPEATITDLPTFDDYRAPIQLFEEKEFNMMGFFESLMGSEFSSNMHFVLMCRDAEESAHTAFDKTRMKPLKNKIVKWNLKDKEGFTVLDDNGYGQISVITPSSQKEERLKLSIDNEVLYVQAGDIGKIVTPPDWCM